MHWQVAGSALLLDGLCVVGDGVCKVKSRYPLGSAEISEKYPRRHSTNSYVGMCHISVTPKSHH